MTCCYAMGGISLANDILRLYVLLIVVCVRMMKGTTKILLFVAAERLGGSAVDDQEGRVPAGLVLPSAWHSDNIISTCAQSDTVS